MKSEFLWVDPALFSFLRPSTKQYVSFFPEKKILLVYDEAGKKEPKREFVVDAEVSMKMETKGKKFFVLEMSRGKKESIVLGFSSMEQRDEWAEKIFQARNRMVEKKRFFGPVSDVEQMELIKVIAKGQLGKVVLAIIKQTEKLVCCKILSKEQVSEVTFANHEFEFLSEIHHPFVQSHVGWLESEKKFYLLWEHVEGEEMFYLLQKKKTLSERVVKFFTAQILLAMSHWHKKGLRLPFDPDNLLVCDDGYLKFVFHNYVRFCKEEFSYCQKEYMSPEMICGEESCRVANDCWILGIFVYEMMTGLPPFYSVVFDEMKEKISKDDLDFSSSKMSDDCKSFVTALLQKDPNKRLQWEDAKNHPWLQDTDWMSIYYKLLEAPYIPKNLSKYDPPIGPIFTEEPVEIDPDRDQVFHYQHFEGFTFQADHSE